MSTLVRILIVEDDPASLRYTALLLRQEGYDVVTAAAGGHATEVVKLSRPDVILLDIGLPDMSGIDVCRRLRARTDLPIIFLSGRREDTDKVTALDAGGDDYVVKPFSAAELAARIRAVLRRSSAPLGSASERLESQEVFLDAAARRVFVRGQEVALTATEFDLLRCLMAQPGRTIARKQILASVWGLDFAGDPNILDSYTRRLRRKIERHPDRPEIIQTVRGFGYRFTDR